MSVNTPKMIGEREIRQMLITLKKTALKSATSLLLLSTSLTSANYAQAMGRTNSSNNLREATNKSFGLPGVDTGKVTTTTVLFLESSLNSVKIAALQKGSLVILVSPYAVKGWQNVIQLSTGHQGWIIAARIKTQFTQHKSRTIAFQTELMESSQPPVLVIRNTTRKVVYVHVGQRSEIAILPLQALSTVVPAGMYTYNASAKNLIPMFGSTDLVNGTKYTWTFVVSSTASNTTYSAINPWLVAENKRQQDAIDSHATELNVLHGQIEIDRPILEKQLNKCNADSDDRDVKRQGLDHYSQTAVDDFNELNVSVNTELDAYQQSLEKFNAEVNSYNFKKGALMNEQKLFYQKADAYNDGH